MRLTVELDASELAQATEFLKILRQGPLLSETRPQPCCTPVTATWISLLHDQASHAGTLRAAVRCTSRRRCPTGLSLHGRSRLHLPHSQHSPHRRSGQARPELRL